MRYFLLFIGFLNNLTAQYCLGSGCGETPVKRIVVLSEMCSGSCFTGYLLGQNLETIVEVDLPFNRHWLPWFGYESSYHGLESDYTFENSEDTLFIILFRDPYDWLQSFYNYNLGRAELHSSFSCFIRGEWDLNMNYESLVKLRKYHPLADYNPETGLPFRNVIELRTAKIKNFLQVPKRVQNYYIINYENVRDNPQEIINEVAEIFNLCVKSEYNPIIYRRNKKGYGEYSPKKYPPISENDLFYINRQLDEEAEKFIGYELES